MTDVSAEPDSSRRLHFAAFFFSNVYWFVIKGTVQKQPNRRDVQTGY